ncbi:MAG: serine protease [Cytophagaceae bacterium]|jgi:S1-C subfamily serine protease|nr:serine protease [Cytophagaceae bacterium]
MKSEQQKIEWMELYWQDNLPAEEKQQLEEELKRNPDLKREFDEYGKIFRSLDVLRQRSALKAKLQALHIQQKQAQRWRKLFKFNPSGIAAAAAVALIISISGVLYLSVKDFGKEDRAFYKELKRDIDQIKQSQKVLWKEVYQKNGQEKNSGTGFAVSSSGHIITSYHLIKDAESIMVYNQEIKSRKAKLLAFDPIGDIALLSIEDTSFTGFGTLPYKMASTPRLLGEKLFTLGYPKEDIVYNEGYISSVTGYNNDSVSYQVSIPVNPGNSGGPLLDAQGNLIGMINGKHKEAEGTAFAVKAGYIRQFYVEKLNDSLQHVLKKTKSNQVLYSRPEQLQRLRKFVVEVRVY